MGEAGAFQARVELPALVRPARLDATGKSGPTRHQARRGRWRQTTYGFHVPAETDSSVLEQFILEQSMRLQGQGVVTGWAALRLHGAGYCDGMLGGVRQPVPLVSPRQLTGSAEIEARRDRIDAAEVVEIAGVRCATVPRAAVDELMRLDDDRERIVLLDMLLAARLTSPKRLRACAAGLRGQRRRRLLAALADADERSLSPQESRMRLVWCRDAGLPRPQCNRLVYDLTGNVVGKPDLLDLEAGVVGEYDGADHRERERHRVDTRRTEAFRRVGLECFTVVAGDSTAEQVDRMMSARARALSDRRPRRWTIVPPPGAWIPREPNLDAELDRADRPRVSRSAP